MTIRENARGLRSTMTRPEVIVWNALRGKALGHQFRRQFPIGPYIADFICLKRCLVIELDGGQHCENPADRERDAWFEARGYRVLRFWNTDVFQNRAGVLEVIREALDLPLLRPDGHLPLAGGRRDGCSED